MIAERLAELEQRLSAERLRLMDARQAVRVGIRRCAQLEGAVGVLRDVLTATMPRRANGPDLDPPDQEASG